MKKAVSLLAALSMAELCSCGNTSAEAPAFDLSGENGSWTYVSGVDFSENASAFAAKVKGKGRIEIFADSIDGKYIAAVEFDCNEFQNVYTNNVEKIEDVHNLYFVISGGDMLFDEWQFIS